jgi:hypothetical protein
MNFFDLISGQEVTIGGYQSIMCWKDGDNLFFDDGKGMMPSVHMYDMLLDRFCYLLDRTQTHTDYFDVEVDGFLIALEDEDEGTRNLCLIDKRLYFMINLPVKHLGALASYLRKENDEAIQNIDRQDFSQTVEAFQEDH